MHPHNVQLSTQGQVNLFLLLLVARVLVGSGRELRVGGKHCFSRFLDAKGISIRYLDISMLPCFKHFEDPYILSWKLQSTISRHFIARIGCERARPSNSVQPQGQAQLVTLRLNILLDLGCNAKICDFGLALLGLSSLKRVEHHSSNEKNLFWLFDIWDYTTQLYGDYNKRL